MNKYFLYFKLFGSNTMKNKTGKKFKNLFGINLIKFSSEFLTHLCHTGSSTNVQNNCIKLSVFGVDITRSTPGNNEKLFVPRKVFNPKIRSQAFRTNPTYFFHYLPFYFRLNKTGNEVFSQQIEIYGQNSFEDVTLYI